MRQTALSIALILSALARATGQDPSAPPQARQDTAADEEVVRISTNLVQVDAVVTDRQGRPVTDLRPEDLEIFGVATQWIDFEVAG